MKSTKTTDDDEDATVICRQ